MRITRLCLFTLALSAIGCTASRTPTSSDQNLRAANGEEAARGKAGGAAPQILVDAGQVVLECPRGSAVGAIHVEFACDAITIYSCKDLSNVVLEFEDGTRQRFEDLSGQTASFSGTGGNTGARIVGVWVKAGNNKSGDGPGYGERFDAPEGPCTPPDGGTAGSGGAGGTGDEDPCQDNDPDTFCGEGDPGDPGSAGAGSAGSGGEPLTCADHPEDPGCHVE